MANSLGVNSALPFNSLSDYGIFELHTSPKKVILNRLEDNDFLKFLKEYCPTTENNFNPASSCKYYDAESFNNNFRKNHSGIIILHLNIRRIAKNRGEFLAFLQTIETDFDIIVLTEIGDNAEYFLNENFLSNYQQPFFELPKNNK